MSRFASLITFFLAFSTVVCSQDGYLDDKGRAREVLLNEQIKSIQFFREGWPLSYPVVRMQNDVPLVLEFDELGKETSTFSYKLIHCDANWIPSLLSEQEYLEGYLDNRFNDYRSSFNTYYNYTHYSLELPNEDISFRLSGNYLVVVFRGYDKSEVVFTRRFMVTESIASIEGRVKIPDLNMYKGCCQEVDFTVNHASYPINDPYSETRVYVYQNGIWDLVIEGLQPINIGSGKLVYDFQDENIFMGGNEYRLFDTKNTRTPTYYIQSIDYIDPYFHFTLKPDKPNKAHLYFSKDDLNGRFFIESSDGSDPAVDADYVFVHFRLDMPFPLSEGSVFIAGDLTNWQFTESNRMEYYPEEQAYMKTLLLKQGVYNYRYIYLPQNAGQFDIKEIEGTHFETENEYLILFYHRPPGGRYDRLIGHQILRSNTE